MQSKNHSALTNSMDFYFERAGGAAVAVTGRVKKSALRAGARAARRLQLQGALKIRPSSGRAGGAAEPFCID